MAPGFTIGRAADNHLVIDESFPNWRTVSQRHAAIRLQEDGQFVIEDRKSHHGILIDDRPTARNLLRNDRKITLGAVEFVFYTTTIAV